MRPTPAPDNGTNYDNAMKDKDQIYVQTAKRNILFWITTISIVAALIIATIDGSAGITIALLGVAAIQGYRCEKADRWLRLNTADHPSEERRHNTTID